MKLSPKTLQILKNFSSINPGIVIKPGNILQTIAPISKSILARAVVAEEFTGTYGIYDLSRFVRSATSIMSDPDFEFGETSVKIYDDSHSILYHYSDPMVIVQPPDKKINMSSFLLEFILTHKDLKDATTALGILGLPEIAAVGDGKNISLCAIDCSKKNNDRYNIIIGETDLTFRAVFKPENLKIIDGDYNVKISSKGFTQFTGDDIMYWISAEANSEF